ncbi:MAG: ABC transporter substrate-binding protein [Microbacterium sp.]
MQRRTSRWLTVGALAAAGTLVLTGCGSGFSETPEAGSGGGELTSSDDALTVLIGSSGDAETAAVNDAVSAWSESSGTDAEVKVASDLTQELSQGFSSGSPADVFYLSTEALPGYAANGSVLAYGDMLENKDDFYPSLVSSFTYEGDFYCAPKDFSSLALQINTDLWTEAGLTDDDIPTTWDELAAVSKTLTTPERVGLTFGAEYQRMGAFMAQAGGNLTNDEGTEATANSPENVEALTFVQSLLKDGSLKYPKDVGAGWGGEAFGKGLAAMTIEGNWITGAMQNDFPDVNYTVVELPEGPAGKGTMQFSNCWGIAADSPNQQAALELVQELTSADSQLAFSAAFGPMPSIQSAAEDWKTANPELVPFLNGADYAQGVPTIQGAVDVMTDLNAQLEGLMTGDPQAILDSAQANIEALLK